MKDRDVVVVAGAAPGNGAALARAWNFAVETRPFDEAW